MLDDPAFSTSNGTSIDQYQPNGGTNQQWKLLAAGKAPVVTDYVVNIVQRQGARRPRFSTSNGTHIEQYQLNGGADQQWVFVPLADGNDLIVNAYSGKVLDDPDFSTEQRDPHRSVPAQWRHQPAMDDRPCWRTATTRSINASSDKVLEDPAILDQ